MSIPGEEAIRENLLKKKKLFLALESFFSNSRRHADIADLYKAYEAAKTSNSHEDYVFLTQKLESSSVEIPGVIFKYIQDENEGSLDIDFSDSYEENETEILLQHIEKFEKYGKKFEKHGKKFEKHDNEIEILGEQINRLLSNFFVKKNSQEIIENIADTFSFIMVSPFSLPGLVAIAIFFMQIASYFLTVSFIYLASPDRSGFAYPNKMNVPRGVDTSVHISQFIAIGMTILVQTEIWEIPVQISNGFTMFLAKQGIEFRWWLLSNSLRFIEGVSAMATTFLLIIHSDNNVDLFKDFTAVVFISNFDNIVFELAKMNVIGQRMNIAVERCKLIVNSVSRSRSANNCFSFDSLRRILFHPTLFAVTLIIMMYGAWLWLLLIPHIYGRYLCQNIYIQLDDSVNKELSYFSGSYTYIERGLYPAYRENKRFYKKRKVLQSMSPMIFRFCNNLGSWVFTLEKNNQEDECNEEFAFVMSGVVENQQKYDFFEVSDNDFSAKFEDERWMPLDDFYVECKDKENPLDTTTLCSSLKIDERKGVFVSTRKWSESFEVLKRSSNGNPVLVYDHLVYRSNTTDQNEYDLIMYLGKRWIITSNGFLKENQFDTDEKLCDYLEYEFHGNWSEYEVAFFSESVTTDTPQDLKTPVSLNWMVASPKILNKTQFADTNRNVESLFLCAKCDNKTNPCLFEGICNADETCNCVSGSSGTLCQVLPIANGLCDLFFNKQEFGFDGGDCCINNCVSSDIYQCGKDKTGLFYVGYDNCETQGCKDCWRESDPSSSISDLVVAFVSLSASGRNLALVESLSRSVRAYDNDGSSWVMRGPVVTNDINLATDSVKVIGHDDILQSSGAFSPVTVVVKKSLSIEVYDWNEMFWKESKKINTDAVVPSNQNQVKEFEVQNNGNSIITLLGNGYVRLFERSHPHPSASWEAASLSYYISSIDNYEFISLFRDGSKFVVGNKTCIQLYDVKEKDIVTNCEDFQGRTIRSTNISPGGQKLAVLMNIIGSKGKLIRYDISNFSFKKISGSFRGLSSENMNIGISDDGNQIFTHSTSENIFQTYQLDINTWSLTKNIESKSFALSSSQKVLAVTSPTTGTVTAFHNEKYCDNGFSKIHWTFVTDQSPGELLWEILHIRKNGENEVLKNGGPYETAELMIIEEFCISDDLTTNTTKNYSCIGVRIFDLGLDGLKSPGRAGISVNGTVVWSLNHTVGYENIYPAFGNIKCLQTLRGNIASMNRNNEDTYEQCYKKECFLESFGGVYHDEDPDNDDFSNSFSLSANGLVLALGSFQSSVVQIFRYTEADGWMQQGSNITGEDNNDGIYHTVDLSFDGSKVAIGALLDNAGNNSIGIKSSQVRIYSYNEISDSWYLHGNVIYRTGLCSHIAYSVSISADGLVVNTSKRLDIDTYTSAECNVHVYEYNKEKNEWDQRGNCMFETGDIVMKISSTGSTLAIGHPFDYMTFGTTGYVGVYEYNVIIKEWEPKGSFLFGHFPGNRFGHSLSISSDGSVLAVSGDIRFPISVYKFSTNENTVDSGGNDDWQQIGQDIEVYVDNELDISGWYIDLTLSSSGSILMVTYDDIIKVLAYDEFRDYWVDSISDHAKVNYTLGRYPRIAASADALTIAARADNMIDMYKLSIRKSIQTDCDESDNFFNFTIVPDQFPEDITWSLVNNKGEWLLGGKLPKNSLQKPQQLQYIECLEKDPPYTFSILDDFEDGVCCDWGDGSFFVEWNQKQVFNSYEEQFKISKTLCLPQEANSALVIVIESFSGMSFHLLDLEGNDVLTEKGDYYGYYKGEHIFVNKCIHKDDCLKFGMVNRYNLDVSLTIALNDTTVYEQDSVSFLEKGEVGKCEIKSCPQNQSLFELDIITGYAPEHLAWQLIDSDGTVLAYGQKYDNEYSYHYFVKCISVTTCLSLTMKNEYCGAYCGTFYNASLDGSPITNFKC